MESYLAILFFIAPGFISRNIIDTFVGKDEAKSDIERTVLAYMLSNRYNCRNEISIFTYKIYNNIFYHYNYCNNCG